MLHGAYDELRLRNVHVMREYPEVQHRERGGNDDQENEQPVETHGAGGEPAGTPGEPAGAVSGVGLDPAGVEAAVDLRPLDQIGAEAPQQVGIRSKRIRLSPEVIERSLKREALDVV